ncbi:MAG: hypothetical protein M0R49_12755 [Limnochordia bacterium]|nr:hypothetical protein [Limnochordia bacterium]
MKKDLLMGIGIGLLLAAVIVSIFPPSRPLTEVQIIQAARDLGMVFPADVKVK